MKLFALPAFDTYPSAVSELTEVVMDIDSCIAQASKVFPEALESLQTLHRRWQWLAMDPCYQLQLVVEHLLDGQDHASFHFNDSDNGFEVCIEIAKDGEQAPAALQWHQNRMQQEFWQGPWPMAATAILSWVDAAGKTCNIQLQSFSSPLRWQCTEIIDGDTHCYDLEYTMWDDVASFYARMLLPQSIDQQIQLDDIELYALPAKAPDLNGVSKEEIIDIWSALIELRCFRGLGSAVDVLVVDTLMCLVAEVSEPILNLATQEKK